MGLNIQTLLDHFSHTLGEIGESDFLVADIVITPVYQNREQRDFDSVQQQLEQRGNRELASSMKAAGQGKHPGSE